MNLQPINPPPKENEHYICTACNSWKAYLADLDGEPFRAYYCKQCADELTTKEPAA